MNFTILHSPPYASFAALRPYPEYWIDPRTRNASCIIVATNSGQFVTPDYNSCGDKLRRSLVRSYELMQRARMVSAPNSQYLSIYVQIRQ